MPTRLTCLFAALLLGACATPTPTTVPKSLENAAPGTAGLVFGSIGAGPDHEALTSTALRLRRVGEQDAASIHYEKRKLSDGSEREDDDGLAHGSVFAQRLPAGDYEVFEASYIWKYGQFGSANFASQRPFLVRFTVLPGRALYLGELRAQRVLEKNAFGHDVTAGSYFSVTDRMARDLELLRRKKVAIDAATVENKVGSFLDAGLPYFR